MVMNSPFEIRREGEVRYSKPIARALLRDKYTVIYIGPDSIVLDKGRTISIHSKPDLLEFKVGCKVTIGKEMEIILLQKNRGDSVERF
jgi:hypothetical protein